MENGWHEEVVFLCNPRNDMILDTLRSLAAVNKPCLLTSEGKCLPFASELPDLIHITCSVGRD